MFISESDATLEPLAGATVAVLGYGNLGRSMARNLRDSGVHVVVGNVDDSYREVAMRDGFDTRDLGPAAAEGDVVFLLLPDEVIPAVYREQVAGRLRAEAAVCFASGYVLAFGLVDPAPDVDVLMLAPRMVGEEVRGRFEAGTGFVSYLSVERDASGRARERLHALALAAGSLRRGALALSARQEATLDLFVEQSVGPYLGAAFQLAFQIGTEAGLPPEALVCELYMSGEMEKTIATMARVGFLESVRWHGLVATYGGFLGTLGMDREAMERHFREVLEQISSGGFARRLQDEEAQGYPTAAAIESMLDLENPLTRAEDRVRSHLGADGDRAADGRPHATPPAPAAGDTSAARAGGRSEAR